MRESLENQLKRLSRIFPKRPPKEAWPDYDKALKDLSEREIVTACDLCIEQCTYFPVPAEIRNRVERSDVIRTVNDSDCRMCGGSGWKNEIRHVEPFGSAAFAVLCDCTKKSKGASA